MFGRALLILLGLGVAAVFGMGVTISYGADNLADKAWVDPVFWALASSGAVLLAIGDLCAWLRTSVARRSGALGRRREADLRASVQADR